MFEKIAKIVKVALWVGCFMWCMNVILTPARAYTDIEYRHQFEEQLVNEASCTINGTINEVCVLCGEINTVIKTEKLPHAMGEYVITIPPSANKEGEQAATCADCGYVDTIPYVCPHAVQFERKVLDATCERAGQTELVCADCTTVLGVTNIPATGHDFGDWWISQSATPEYSGTKQRQCRTCEKIETQYYQFTMGANAIYAPGTKLNHNFVVCAMTQGNVDSYDIIYTHVVDYYGVGPFIIGHNYGSMRYISQIKVGQKIYVSVNGNIQTYKVIISEFAMQNDAHTDIVGQSSGASIWDDFGVTTLRMYTCYGGTNGRWVVFATKC